MAQVIIRNLDDQTVSVLKARAARRGESLEQSLRDLLQREAKATRAELLAKIDAIRARTRPRSAPPLAEDLIREDRDAR